MKWILPALSLLLSAHAGAALITYEIIGDVDYGHAELDGTIVVDTTLDAFVAADLRTSDGYSYAWSGAYVPAWEQSGLSDYDALGSLRFTASDGTSFGLGFWLGLRGPGSNPLEQLDTHIKPENFGVLFRDGENSILFYDIRKIATAPDAPSTVPEPAPLALL